MLMNEYAFLANDDDYTICENCRSYVHIEDVISIVATGELFCFPCKNEYESEESE